jgi:hypothetical protein
MAVSYNWQCSVSSRAAKHVASLVQHSRIVVVERTIGIYTSNKNLSKIATSPSGNVFGSSMKNDSFPFNLYIAGFAATMKDKHVQLDLDQGIEPS